MVPDPATATEADIWRFFHSYHAYIHWGGLEQAFAAVEKVAEEIDQQPELLETDQDFIMWPEPAIDLIRTDAFLELRAARHQDPMSPPVDWESMRQRLAHLRWVMQQMETHDG